MTGNSDITNGRASPHNSGREGSEGATQAWGHSVAELLRGLADVPGDILDAARALDKHYIPARYPNSHPTGAPGDLYTAPEADRVLAEAESIIEYVRRRLSSA